MASDGDGRLFVGSASGPDLSVIEDDTLSVFASFGSRFPGAVAVDEATGDIFAGTRGGPVWAVDPTGQEPPQQISGV